MVELKTSRVHTGTKGVTIEDTPSPRQSCQSGREGGKDSVLDTSRDKSKGREEQLLLDDMQNRIAIPWHLDDTYLDE